MVVNGPGPRPLRVRDNGVFLVHDRVRAEARPLDAESPLPSRKRRRAFLEPRIEPGEGEGVLSVALDAGETAPVLAVDGVPVAVGRGQVDLVLAAGPHTVEVQGTAVAAPYVARIDPGGSCRLQFYANPHTGFSVLGELPESYDFVPTNAGCAWWLVLVSLVCCLPYSVAAFFSDELRLSAVVAAAVSVALIALCLPLSRSLKATHQKRLDGQRLAKPRKPEPYPWGASDLTGPVYVGTGSAPAPPVPPGMVAIDLELTCLRRLETGRGRADDSFLSRAWTSPPRVRIDGAEVPASWGRWRYHFPPGAHGITVTVDGRPGNLTLPCVDPQAPEAVAEILIEAEPDQVKAVRGRAEVAAAWNDREGRVEAGPPRLVLAAR